MPTSATAAANVMNQFELPVLFHVVCLALFVTAGVSFLSVTLAWLFVVLRYVHAWLHLAGRLGLRSLTFAIGFVVLALMWLYLALHLLQAV